MKKLNSVGGMDPFIIPTFLMTLLFVGAAIFGYWAYTERQDYKNNVDQKIAEAVEVAKKQEGAVKDSEFAEKEKLPLKDYQGPSAYNNIDLKYPKTWSGYVEERVTAGGTPIDAYFHPVFVPGIQSRSAYALRLQMINSTYAQAIKQYDSQVRTGKLRATAYVPAKVQNVTGMRFDGELMPNMRGAVVMVPIRDKTLKIWTESEQFVNDFNNNILPNYSFEL